MRQGGPAFSPQEQEHYRQLFANVDADGSGFVGSLSARDFLMASGVPKQWLRTIWEIAARGQPGLDLHSFSVAMRLVAHAQAGRPPVPELIAELPPALPDLPTARRRRRPSETSLALTDLGVARSEAPSELQPVLTAGEEQVRRATEAVKLESRRGRSPSPAPRAWTHDQWRPSRRMLRKYAELFQRTDGDGDGFVEGREAAVLLERSRLDPGALAGIRMLADQDRDGGYVWPEFVCLVHMVTALTRGAEPPGELPRELKAALSKLEPVEVLAQERQASRSRSASPAPVAPGFGAGGADAFGAADAFGVGTEGAGGGFGFGPDPAFGADPFDSAGLGEHKEGKKDKKHKKDKKGKHGGEDELFGGGAGGGSPGGLAAWQEGPTTSAAEDRMERLRREDEDAMERETREQRKRFEREEDRMERLRREEEDAMEREAREQQKRLEREEEEREAERRERARQQVDDAVQRFEAIVAADREVSRSLEQEVEGLEEELGQLQDSGNRFERQVREARGESRRLRDQGDKLERELDGLRDRLEGLKEDQRAVSLDSLSLRRDRAHLAEELSLLQRMLAQEEQSLQVVWESNKFLDAAYRELEEQTAGLDLQRRELLQAAAEEGQMLKAKEREGAELRSKLDRMRREQASAIAEQQERQRRDRQVRAMQGDPGGHGRDDAGQGGHSWASALVGGPAAGGASAAAPLTSKPSLVPHAAAGREGV